MRAPDHRIVLGLHRSRHECGLLAAALDLGITRIDTSFNYRDFTSHAALSRLGSGLLDRCSLSTKVGFFPRHDGTAEHSLDAARLRQALEQTNRDLRRAPDLVFLHNPERSLPGTPRDAREKLGAACAVLEDAVAGGLCGAWGIASWDPAPLAAVVDGALPAPSVLTVPAGLLAGIATLDAAQTLAEQWQLGMEARWGMSPFGGSTNSAVWEAVDARMFLQPEHRGASRVQAAFRAAYLLPPASCLLPPASCRHGRGGLGRRRTPA
ncbi:aldo/keto reductase [Streptomyces sp. NBC_00400]|uniref:aldo/keto reductase n=1 Tax=Streptomyces sp. NBC_00400 TaxID=2975737 RepID=UPI002E2243E2